MKHDPITADGRDAVADYSPVQLSRRRNGWTAERQRVFLIALAETGSVSVACKVTGITARSAYRLRADPRGEAFALAWHRALYVATNTLVALAFERATKGKVREIWKNGELVSEVREPSDTMLKFLLTRLMPSMFNARPSENWGAAWHAQQNFPGSLDQLTDCDVRADRLSAVDFEPEPRAREIDPPLPPGQEEESWQEDVDYGHAEPWGEPAAADAPRHVTEGETDSLPARTLEQRAADYRLDELDEDAADANDENWDEDEDWDEEDDLDEDADGLDDEDGLEDDEDDWDEDDDLDADDSDEAEAEPGQPRSPRA